jgi:hypothetical protein
MEVFRPLSSPLLRSLILFVFLRKRKERYSEENQYLILLQLSGPGKEQDVISLEIG